MADFTKKETSALIAIIDGTLDTILDWGPESIPNFRKECEQWFVIAEKLDPKRGANLRKEIVDANPDVFS